MVGKSKLFNGRKEKASSYSLFQSILNNNEEKSIARDVSVKSLNNSLFQSSLFSNEKKDETRDFLERSWSDVSTPDFLKYKAKSLIINMSEKIRKWKNTIFFNNKKNISFSNILKHQIFQLENKEATKFLKGKSISQKRFNIANQSLRAPSVFTLDTNVNKWLARFDNYLELNRTFGDRDKINVLGSFLDDTTFKLVDSLINERSYDEVKTKFRALFSRPESSAHVYLHTFVVRGQELNESLVQYAAVLQELGRKAFPDLNLRELDIYLRGQFQAGVRDREMAERLAVLDHENLEMLVFRAREHEGLPFRFSGIRERSRNMFNQGTRRQITEGEIRNLITLKLESNIMFQNHNKHYGNSQNNVETIRNSYDNSFVIANLSNMSNFSKLLNNSNDGSYLNSTSRNYMPNYPVQKPAMRCFLCNQEGHIKRNCPNWIRNMNNQYYRLGYDSQYSSLNRSTPMATIRNDQRKQFSANTNNINEESDNYDLEYVFGKLGCKELQKTKGSFTTANGQPLNVIGFYTASLRIGTNEVKLDVFVAVDLQHDCLIGLDYMGKHPRYQSDRLQTIDINPQLHDKEIVTVLGWKDASENSQHNESHSGDLRTYCENGSVVINFCDYVNDLKERLISLYDIQMNYNIGDKPSNGNENNLDSPRLPSCDAENNHHIPEDFSPTSQVMPVRSDSEDLSPSECNQFAESENRAVILQDRNNKNLPAQKKKRGRPMKICSTT
ncbi:Transposon Ty3-I Gag-Pol poly [Brachionus plicatilis]|uniref:Transposon Ty3-I Gag-Pol poly n=1 Tax=Brachionus plicatilis TaxID=10195 RepID=A0A3M7S2E4_BRAPC|nr:Transposon Ty3-I Gag-Pol poly [Brachionus plicatilis]